MDRGNLRRNGQAATLALLREYSQAMDGRIASLRGRASPDAANDLLTEAFQELDTTREELTVAEEELASAEARYEAALRALEAQVRHYAELFDGSPDGYVVTDPMGLIREGNATVAAMLGVPKRFLEGRPFVNFVARGDVRRYRDALGSLLRGHGDGDLLPLHLRPRHGEAIFVGEAIPRVVRSGDHVAAIRWTLRKAAERKREHEEGDGPDEPPSSASPA